VWALQARTVAAAMRRPSPRITPPREYARASSPMLAALVPEESAQPDEARYPPEKS